jgi:glycosyltransferase involved in cell wall biosynthesis
MTDNKKILFLITQSEFGGAQRFIYTLVANLDRSKYDIVVSAGLEGDDENGLLYLLKKQGIKTERLRYLRRSINPFFDFLGLLEIKKLLKKEKPDILFLCSTKAGFLGSLAARLNTKYKIQNTIYRIGGWTFNDPWPKWKKDIYIFLEKISAKWKDYIVNNAKSDAEQAIKLGIKPKKEILVIHNGIDVDGLEFLSKEEARSKLINLMPNSNGRIVGTIANDYPSKGLRCLREAGKQLHNVKLVILSNLPEAFKYLKAFDIFVLPSVKEGFPWVVLEAMAANLPVVATEVGAMPEIIQNNENGILVEPRNPEAIAEAIKRLLNDDNLRNKIANNGRETVKEKFNLGKMLEQYENLFSLN